MATKYYCDACGSETRNYNDLRLISRGAKAGSGAHTCDICEKCAEKIFKPVKEWRSTWTAKVEWKEDCYGTGLG